METISENENRREGIDIDVINNGSILVPYQSFN